MLGSLEISSMGKLGGVEVLEVGMPARRLSQGSGVNSTGPFSVTVGIEGKVWMRDPGREMYWVSVSDGEREENALCRM